jgi:beta-glucosidase
VLAPVHPVTDSDDDRAAARRMDGHMNRWFLDPVLRGRYPEDLVRHYDEHVGPLDAVQDGDLDVISRPIDFLGVNYYFPVRVRADASAAPLALETVPGPPPLTAMGWEVAPEGLHELLVRVRDDYGDLPIDITENGAAFDDPPPRAGVVDDPQRVAYLEGHLQALARAIADGVDVRRYFAWSLMDNFEWSHGYSKRFGVVHVDYATQRRTIKRSGWWYRSVIERTQMQRTG